MEQWKSHKNEERGVYEVYGKTGDGRICSIMNGSNEEKHAKLIAEAGTVYNETGFTPRQLAEQKAALLAACKALLAIQDTDSMFRLPANLTEIAEMRAAIAAATGK